MTLPQAKDVPLADQCVAGEEDPGACLDMASQEASRPMAPGDEAPPGTPGTGEDMCRRCGGTGRIGETDCPDCAGTGTLVQGIGGG